MQSRIQLAIAGAVVLIAVDVDPFFGNEPNPELAVLERHEIEPTLEGITTFLNSLDPQSPVYQRRLTRANELIRQLGDESYQERESAHRSLLLAPFLSPKLIAAATRSSDPEIAWRARSILAATSPSSAGRTNSVQGVTEAACRTIIQLDIKGAAAVLLATLQRFEDETTLGAIRAATVATTESGDDELLRNSLTAPNPQVRIAAISALTSLLGEAAQDDIAAMLDDSHDRVRLTASYALGNAGDRRSLATLVDLLGSEQLDARARAAQLLRGLTGKRFNFVAYESPENRVAAAKNWAAWFHHEGATATLHFPIRLSSITVGRTLITDYSSNRVTEVDRKGKTTWTVEINSPWGCQGLPNGHRVISSYRSKRVVEYDSAGKEVWRREGLPGNAMGLHRLEDGNTIVACSTSNKVVEYRRDGSLAWSATIPGRPVDVERLENGRTLVALESTKDGQKIVEVDRAGKVVWEIANIRKPLSVDRLESGNTLVATANGDKVVEYDRAGKIVWEHATGIKATDARRLENGDTIIGCHKFVQQIDRAGNVKWEVSGLKYCYGIHHY